MKVVLLILSCNKYKARVLHQKNEWLNKVEMKYYHVIGGHDSEYLFNKNTLYVDSLDDYKSLPNKLISAIRAIKIKYNPDYIFKTDDDQIPTNPDILNSIVNRLKSNHIDYGGMRVDNEKTWYCNGRFYILSRDAYNNLLSKRGDFQRESIEDLSVGIYLDNNYKNNYLSFNSDKAFRDLIMPMGLYINMDTRKDRDRHFRNLQTKYSLFCTINRMSAEVDKNSAIGCGKSHVKALKYCKQLNQKYYMICEDDLTILNDNNYKGFLLGLSKLLNYDRWDIIVLTPRGQRIKGTLISQLNGFGFNNIIDNQTTTGYIIKHSMIDVLIDNIEEAIEMLKKTGDHKTYAIDQYWKRLQYTYSFVYYRHIFAGQLVGYSDIEKRNINYNDVFLQQK